VACEFARIRGRAHDPAAAVLAHGDAHAWNTLMVPDSEPHRFKFIDPDGLFIERGYDLGISMRGWSGELLAGDPVLLGGRRCLKLAQLTGVDPQPIWQWGFIERVSTGLVLTQLGLSEGHECLAVADAWSSADPQGF
jgi:streptomycin 6-kinase